MPLRNRVLPTGEIVADPGRGLMMGNRGCLHGPGRDLGGARWRSTLWICCVRDWKGVARDPMPPGRWTALFFLDEVTALAAGHRPCAYCRRPDYLDYAHAWQAAQRLERRPWAKEMDATLHGQRVRPRREQLTHRAPATRLPDGVIVRDGGTLGLLAGRRLHRWSWSGYGAPQRVAAEVEVLTPPASVAAIAAGYRPLVHPSAPSSPGLRVDHGEVTWSPRRSSSG
jgi:hypothetical protein